MSPQLVNVGLLLTMPQNEVVYDLTVEELRELVPQLQSLTVKYKRSEKIQKALYHISELSSSLDDVGLLYREIHEIVASFMPADNFFVAFYDPKSDLIQFSYVVDERDEDEFQTVPYEEIKHGVTAHLLRTGENLVLTKENFKQLKSEHNLEIIGSPPVDLIGVPILRDGQVSGAMVVQSYNDNIRFDSEDLEILVFISQHIVTALDRLAHRDWTEKLIEERTQQLLSVNKSLETEITERKRIEQLQKALFEISELAVNADDNILEFYTQLHHILKQLINAENFYIALLDNEKENLSFPYFIGRNEDFHSTRKLNRGLTEYVVRSNKSILIDKSKIKQLVDSQDVEEKFVIRMLKEGNSWMGAPLRVDEQVKGVIAVQTYGLGEDYDQDDLDLLTFVSQHISVAMERREAANELVIYNQQLSQKVKERTTELNKTNKSLKRQIEQRKEVELKLIHDAHHDGLTRLPNRVMFTSRLELALASKSRYAEHNFALLFIDLDRFKSINDTLGHHAGDEFLIEASKRISHCKRSHDLLARLGGDEFVILVDKYINLADVEAIAQRIVDSISTPFSIEGKEIFSGASIGIAELTSEYKSADDVLRDADAAMYQAKSLGRNRYVLFDISMRKQLLEELDKERDFRNAFESRKFTYQLEAISHLENDSTLFFENTVSWADAEKHFSYGYFWELADKTGLSYGINKALIENTFAIIDNWQGNAQYKDTKIGFSLSLEYLLYKSSFSELVEIIESKQSYQDQLVIQISETSLLRFEQYMPSIINKLNALGVDLVLENFGSESASLVHLFKYDFSCIRLNDKLINSFNMSDKYHRLVNAIYTIASDLGIEVIADGINDQANLEELLQMGCRFGTGSTVKQK